MSHTIIYWTLLVGVLAYAIARGGAPERAAASVWFVSSVLSWVALNAHPFPMRFRSVEVGVFAIDVLTLVALIWLMIKANRRWPIVVAGLLFTTVAAHIVKLISPDMIRIVYAILIAYLSYPALLTIAVGIHLHQRRLKRFGSDPDWRRYVPPLPIEHR